MIWTWDKAAELICTEYCVNKCSERGDVCPFTDRFEVCEKLFNATKSLEKKYLSMLRSGVDENDPRLLKLDNLYYRAGDVYDCEYQALCNAVSD